MKTVMPLLQLLAATISIGHTPTFPRDPLPPILWWASARSGAWAVMALSPVFPRQKPPPRLRPREICCCRSWNHRLCHRRRRYRREES